VDDKTRTWGAPFALRKDFELYDKSNSGLLPLRTVQSILEELGMVLTASDLYAISSTYGRDLDDKVYYDSLCRAVDNWQQLKPAAWQGTADGLPPRRGAPASAASSPPYVNPAVIARLVELRERGRDPRDLFEAMDINSTGMVGWL
jgi:hypothetical protein